MENVELYVDTPPLARSLAAILLRVQPGAGGASLCILDFRATDQVRRGWRATDNLKPMKRIHRKLFVINDRLAAIDRELAQTRAELEYHRSIDDDAQRDAAVGNYIDREEAGLTRGDVRRFEKTIDGLTRKREALLEKQSKLLQQLPS